MNILILGATGMLGHTVCQKLHKKHRVIGTIRTNISSSIIHPALQKISLIGNIDALDLKSITDLVIDVNPDVIINCIGIVKQLPQAHDPISSITLNSLFPHQLAQVCNEKGIRLIHYSTDCVFSGRDGNYSETDIPDPEDLYGRTKLLGEVIKGRCLTLRTSLIGRELTGFHSLFEWVLQQDGGEIHGYTKAIFSGLTTIAHAHILDEIITNHKVLTGLYHVASTPISKFDLISMLIKRFNLNIAIIPDDIYTCDRSLDGTRFIQDTGISIPSLETMIEQLYNDKTPYNNHRYVHE